MPLLPSCVAATSTATTTATLLTRSRGVAESWRHGGQQWQRQRQRPRFSRRGAGQQRNCNKLLEQRFAGGVPTAVLLFSPLLRCSARKEVQLLFSVPLRLRVMGVAVRNFRRKGQAQFLQPFFCYLRCFVALREKSGRCLSPCLLSNATSRGRCPPASKAQHAARIRGRIADVLRPPRAWWMMHPCGIPRAASPLPPSRSL